MGDPIIRRTTTGKTKTNIERLLRRFIETKAFPEVGRMLGLLDKKWDKPENLADFRKKLRDEIKLALDPANDPVHKSGPRRYEARIVILAAILSHMIDEDFQVIMQDQWR